jgi:hypothetical protein
MNNQKWILEGKSFVTASEGVTGEICVFDVARAGNYAIKQ